MMDVACLMGRYNAGYHQSGAHRAAIKDARLQMVMRFRLDRRIPRSLHTLVGVASLNFAASKA